jgi:hypothetical protein
MAFGKSKKSQQGSRKRKAAEDDYESEGIDDGSDAGGKPQKNKKAKTNGKDEEEPFWEVIITVFLLLGAVASHSYLKNLS